MDNCYIIAKKILELLKVPHTNGYLKDLILSHPEFPSLLSISDTLSKYEIDYVPIKVGQEKLDQLPLPSLVQVSGGETSHFYILTYVSKDKIKYLNENGFSAVIERQAFVKLWTGIALIVETTERSAEPEIAKRRKDKWVKISLLSTSFLSILIWIGVGFSGQSTTSGGILYQIYPLLYFLLKVAGLLFSIILLWHEVDSNNPKFKNFCYGGKIFNCDAVLKSQFFNLLGGAINLSSVAFAYFLAGFFFLIINSFDNSAFTFLGFLSLFSLSIVVLSFYYQGRIIKKWCRFCLLVQCVLVLEVLISWIGQFYTGGIEIKAFPSFIVLFTAGILGWVFLKPLLAVRNDIYFYKRDLYKIKNNKEVFGKLLSKSRKITTDPYGLGIFLKNESPKYHVLKVCNPYCKPCSQSHTILERLFREGSIDLQILFFPEESLEDPKSRTIGHFLAIASEGNSEITKSTLDKWYRTDNKDEVVFSEEFKSSSNLEQYHDKLQAMREWCIIEGISHTPTIFINGYELPSDYRVEDLDYILN